MKGLLIVLLPFIASPCFSQPFITSVSGTLTHNSTLTVSGSGFGTKSRAEPYVWDDFERGANGQNISGTNPAIGPAWKHFSSGGSTQPVYTNDPAGQRLNSTLSSYHNFQSAAYSVALQLNNSCTTCYFTFWWKWHMVNGVYPRNIKPWIVWGTDADGVMPAAYAGFGDNHLNDGVLRNSIQDIPPPNFQVKWSNYTWIAAAKEKWMRFEGYVVQSDPNVSNGSYQFWTHDITQNPAIRLDLANVPVMTRTTAGVWDQWVFGAYVANDQYGPLSQAWVDDIYFDTTQARVEIGDAPTWATCTHREIQIPSSWTANSIQITLNQGSFSTLKNIYLYVVDATGSVSQNGFQLGQEAPQIPTGLKVQ